MANSRARTVIVDYGTGNLHSVKKALDRLGADCFMSSNARDIASADKIILPGVGHFGAAMANLNELELVDALNEAVTVRQKPILGICLGVELMSRHSEEGDASGLGWFNGVSVKFDHPDRARFKVPHMGWNQVRVHNGSRLMRDVAQQAEFYFAHSYYLRLDDQDSSVGETEYGTVFPSVIERENVFGVQFHPEKSHDAGSRVLENFIQL